MNYRMRQLTSNFYEVYLRSTSLFDKYACVIFHNSHQFPVAFLGRLARQLLHNLGLVATLENVDSSTPDMERSSNELLHNTFLSHTHYRFSY